ncbi:hypothetical protein HID58_004169 [Brassica napus]|uniref:Protein EXORDIUM-like 2 n=1 Tax=Brassica napus TaxID=3708 RepID=A0ABQ8E5J4_BRANA|nr:hypothetical protein HID58_004169 [Brassica napus]
MAYTYRLAALLVLISATVGFSSAVSVEHQLLKLNATLFKGNICLNISNSVQKNINLNIVWYGKFTPIQRTVFVDFIRSLNSPAAAAKDPSVASWWKTTEKYKGGASTIVLGKQLLLEDYPLGKSLKSPHLRPLSGKFKGGGVGSITAVLTAKDVTVEGFCMNRCGTHGSKSSTVDGGAYLWVGNSEEQCPGYCAWPFHQPLYGPQTPPLIAPNGDVGVDGMIINLATLLVNTVTNQEAVSTCTGMFGSGAYPGYPGRVLVDKTTGASYNALGLAGRKYLLPAMWDPQTSKSALLVLLTATVVFSSAMMDEQPFRPSSINNISLNIVWYGKFTPIQRAVIVDFIRSLNSPSDAKGPSVASWWKTTEKYKGGASKIVLGKQLLLEDYPFGKSLKSPHLKALSGKLNGGGVGLGR